MRPILRYVLTGVLASWGILALPAFSATPAPVRNGLIDVGALVQQSEDGTRTPALSADALAPFFGHLYIGPEVRLNHQDGHVNWAVGGLAELQFGSPHVQPFLSLDIIRWEGQQDATGRYQGSVGGGIRLGGDRFYLRASAALVGAYNSDGKAFGTNSYGLGVGFRL